MSENGDNLPVPTSSDGRQPTAYVHRSRLDPGWQMPSADKVVDLNPAVILLRLLAQATTKAAWYADIIRLRMQDEGDEVFVTRREDKHGSLLGEDISVLLKLEFQERKFAADTAVRAIGAGLAQMQIELQAAQTQVVIGAMTKLAQSMGLDTSDPQVRMTIVNALTAAQAEQINVVEGSVEPPGTPAPSPASPPQDGS